MNARNQQVMQHPLYRAGLADAMTQLLANPAPPGSPEMGVPGQVPQADMSVRDGQRVPPGALVQYYSDLASGVIVPEDMRIENIEFRVQIDPSGNIVAQTPSMMLVSRYNFVLRRIMGFMMDPQVAGAAPSLLNVNLKEDGRNFTVFKKPMSMASLIQMGSNSDAAWDGVYITVPGTQLEAQWFVDAARWAALVGTTKEIGIQVLGDYVACTPE